MTSITTPITERNTGHGAGEVAALAPQKIAEYPLPGGGRVLRFDTGPFNWYVIEEGGRLTLVDAGFPGHYRTFRAGLAAIGRSVGDVEAIVLTHAHADHMGFIERLRRETGAPVFVHREDAAAAKRVLQLPWFTLLSNGWHPYVAGMLTHATVNGILLMPGIGETRSVEDGERLDIPGRPTVLHVPGHTPGQIALLTGDGGTLLAGDTLVTRSLLRGTADGPQLASRGLNHDTVQSARSLDRYKFLGEITLLTGHGPVWRGKAADAVAASRARLAQP